MNIHARPVLIYRWITFLLAAGYSLYQIFSSDYDSAFGPFRFLTIWALLFSFFAASRMLALSERRITRRHEVTAMCASVLNAMVVLLYWKLWFTDPALVNGGGPIIWHQEYYLHALGPALQIFDALFIGRVFRRAWRAALPILAIIGVYVAWAELVVQRFNDTPSGPVTSGLPYPFLNAMEFPARAGFYSSNAAVALVFLAGFAVLGWIIRRQAGEALPQPGQP